MDIIQIAKSALEEKYGAKPPQKIVTRFNEEIALLKHHGVESIFSTAYNAAQEHMKGHRVFYVQGSGAASFLSYLLGISRANPLPAHHYCPTCKKVIWRRVKYGCDLPSWTCDCGADMEGDGYNIAKEYFWNNIYRISEIAFGFAGQKELDMLPWYSCPFPEQLSLWAFYHNSITNRGEYYHPDDCTAQMAVHPFFFSYRDDIIDYLVRRKVYFQDAYIVADDVRRGSVGRKKLLPLINASFFSDAQISEFESTKYLYPKAHAIEALLAIGKLYRQSNSENI